MDTQEEAPCFVYCLICTNGMTYVGATKNLDRRLRQHNAEIKGGAVATTCHVKKGHSWRRLCYVKNFPSWQAALQFEWRWKLISRQKRIKKQECAAVMRRKTALDDLLLLERSTTAAVPFAEWAEPPEVVWEETCD
jgi:structure-specific endonuclease subunit SLX1